MKKLIVLLLLLIIMSTAALGTIPHIVPIERPGNQLELGEYLGDVTEAITDADTSRLASYDVDNLGIPSSVNQYLRFKWGLGHEEYSRGKVVVHENDYDQVHPALYFRENEPAFQNELEFTEGFFGRVDATTGNIPEFVGQELNILSERFQIYDAEYDTSLQIKLIADPMILTMEEGETRTISYNGVSYPITLLIVGNPIDPTEIVAKVTFDGEISKSLEEKEIEYFRNGLTIVMNEIRMGTTGISSDIATFIIGTYVSKLEDTDPTSISDGTFQVNEENIEDSYLNIDYSITGDVLRINNIEYTLNTDGILGAEVYIPEGEKYSEHHDEPEGMFSKQWDIEFLGLSAEDYSELRFYHEGNDQIRLSFTNTQGIDYDIPYTYLIDDNMYFGGDSRSYFGTKDALIFEQSSDIMNYDMYARESDYIVLTYSGSSGKFTRILQPMYLEPNWEWPFEGTAYFRDAGTGSIISSNYIDLSHDNPGTGTVSLEGFTFRYWIKRTGSVGRDRTRILFDIDGDGLPGGKANIWIEGEGELNLGEQSTTTFNAPIITDINPILTTEASRIEYTSDDEVIQFTISGDDTTDTIEIDYEINTNIGLQKNTPDTEDIITGTTNYGIEVTLTDDLNPSDLTINYPQSQIFPIVNVIFYQEDENACSDGIDNDGDGLIDMGDIGCDSTSDDDEHNEFITACSDGIDNDGDGLIDYPVDPGCTDVTDDNEFNFKRLKNIKQLKYPKIINLKPEIGKEIDEKSTEKKSTQKISSKYSSISKTKVHLK